MEILEDGYKIEISPAVVKKEWEILVKGLNQYNEEKVGPPSKKTLIVTHMHDETPITLYGALHQHTLYLPLDQQREALEKYPDVFNTFLKYLPNKVESHITCVFFSKRSDETEDPFIKILQKNEFSCGAKIAMNAETYRERPYAYYKITPFTAVEENKHITLLWDENSEDVSLPPYPQIGVFMRNNKEETVGGVSARVYQEDSTEAFI
jgi:hypothetical protein